MVYGKKPVSCWYIPINWVVCLLILWVCWSLFNVNNRSCNKTWPYDFILVTFLMLISIYYPVTGADSSTLSGPELQGQVPVMEVEHSHCSVHITLFTFILSLHWDGVLSYPSSDRALDTRSYMAGPGALPENTVPAASSCCILASVSLSLPQTAMRAFVSDGVHDIPRQAVKLLEEDEAAVRPAAPELTFKGEKRFGVEGLEWYWLLSLKSSDSGDGTSVFGIFNGVDISGECSALLDAAMLPLLLRGGGGKVTCGALR